MHMKKVTGKRFVSFLAAAVVFSSLSVPALAKDEKSTKIDKKTPAASGVFAITTESSAVSGTFIPAAFAVAALEDAKEIALSHAGADSASAVFTKAKLDKGVYELKFSDIYGKYEYEVAAADGAILDYQWEIKNLRFAIPLESAKEVALNHAGVDGANAEFTKEKLDETVYELKFNDENGKYEYEISAADGTILDYDWDVRLPAGSVPAMPENWFSWEGSVTREQAIQTALEAAKVSRETLKYLVCYVSWKNHVPTAYEVKFATRWETYHYTINLDTGAILGSNCQPHH